MSRWTVDESSSDMPSTGQPVTAINPARLKGENRYYVYAFLRESMIPYYIGRGCGYRAWSKAGRAVKAPSDKGRIRVIKAGLSFEAASNLEAALIEFWGRKDGEMPGVLANMQDGGGGGSPGRAVSESHKQRLREAQLGRKHSPELITRRLRWQEERGPNMAQHHREAITEAVRGCHRVWWRHEELDLDFFGTSTELSERFTELFASHLSPSWKKLRSGCKLCRDKLRLAWRGKIPHYKGWTRGSVPGEMC